VNLELDPVQRMTRDLVKGSITLGADEARFLVDTYYAMQDQRIRGSNQVRALTKTDEPHDVVAWVSQQSEVLEKQVKRALESYAKSHPVGQWALSITGIGPVITAGLLAHVDITKCPTVGHIWRYAGLDPTSEWRKGEKRPWNASLKVLCWKIGESFVKTKGLEGSIYGAVYEQRKKYEQERNERGDYREQAEETLRRVPTHKQRAIYLTGRLPDGRIHRRAARYATKLFLSHLHEVWYRHHFRQDPPLPYPIAHLGHAHKVEPPRIPHL
jgi:hypothetical protein